MNKRRKFIIALGASAILAPLPSFAQGAPRIRLIGWLLDREPNSLTQDAFRSGMRELGYVEGKDYQIALRFTTNDFERLPTLVAELVSLKVELILIAGTASANAARKLAPEIPLVVPAAGDPVGTGLANTLARPGGMSQD